MNLKKFLSPFTKLGQMARKAVKADDIPEAETPRKESYIKSDRFWLTRWIRDWKFKRVGLTTITWISQEYGYRSDYERVPKSQIDDMRRSQPHPVHRSGRGWKEWVLIQDDHLTPFPVVMPEGTDFVNQYCNPTAVDLHLYMVDKHIDNSLSAKKKSDIPVDGKMLVVVMAIVVVLVFFMMGIFS